VGSLSSCDVSEGVVNILGVKKGVMAVFAVFYSSVDTVFLHTYGKVVKCKTHHSEHRL
jgi:hypothetical protein